MSSLKDKFKPTRPLMRKRTSTRRPFFFTLSNCNQLSAPPEDKKRSNERRNRNTELTDRNFEGDAQDENQEVMSNEQNDAETESISSRETQPISKNKTLESKKSGISDTIKESNTPSLDVKKKPFARKLLEKFLSPSVQSLDSNLSPIKANSSAVSARETSVLKEKNSERNESNFEFAEASFTRISGGEVNVNNSSTVDRLEKSEQKQNSDDIQNASALNDFGSLKRKSKDDLNLSGISLLKENGSDTPCSQGKKTKNRVQLISLKEIIGSVANKSTSHKQDKRKLLDNSLSTVIASPILNASDVNRQEKIKDLKSKRKDVSIPKSSGQSRNEYLTPPEKSPPVDIDAAIKELFKPLKRKRFSLSQESRKILEKRKIPKLVFEVDTDSDPKSFQLTHGKPINKASGRAQLPEPKKLLLRQGISFNRKPTDITDLEVGLSVVVTAFREIRSEVHDNDMLNMLKTYEENVIQDISDTVLKVVQLQEKGKIKKKLVKDITEKSETLVRIVDERLKQKEAAEAV